MEVVVKIPEVTVGTGNRQIRLTGREAIEAAGWSLWLLIAARAFSVLASAVVLLLAGLWGFPRLPALAEVLATYL
jgi:hypothetical protein